MRYPSKGIMALACPILLHPLSNNLGSSCLITWHSGSRTEFFNGIGRKRSLLLIGPTDDSTKSSAHSLNTILCLQKVNGARTT